MEPIERLFPGAVPVVVRAAEEIRFYGTDATTASGDTVFVPANPRRKSLTIQNIGAADVYWAVGASFPPFPGVLAMGGFATITARGEVRVKASAGTISVRAQEETY